MSVDLSLIQRLDKQAVPIAGLQMETLRVLVQNNRLYKEDILEKQHNRVKEANESSEEAARKWLARDIGEVIAETGIKYLVQTIRDKDVLFKLLEPVKINHKHNNPKNATVLRKRLTERLLEKGVHWFLREYHYRPESGLLLQYLIQVHDASPISLDLDAVARQIAKLTREQGAYQFMLNYSTAILSKIVEIEKIDLSVCRHDPRYHNVDAKNTMIYMILQCGRDRGKMIDNNNNNQDSKPSIERDQQQQESEIGEKASSEDDDSDVGEHEEEEEGERNGKGKEIVRNNNHNNNNNNNTKKETSRDFGATPRMIKEEKTEEEEDGEKEKEVEAHRRQHRRDDVNDDSTHAAARVRATEMERPSSTLADLTSLSPPSSPQHQTLRSRRSQSLPSAAPPVDTPAAEDTLSQQKRQLLAMFEEIPSLRTPPVSANPTQSTTASTSAAGGGYHTSTPPARRLAKRTRRGMDKSQPAVPFVPAIQLAIMQRERQQQQQQQRHCKADKDERLRVKKRRRVDHSAPAPASGVDLNSDVDDGDNNCIYMYPVRNAAAVDDNDGSSKRRKMEFRMEVKVEPSYIYIPDID